MPSLSWRGGMRFVGILLIVLGALYLLDYITTGDVVYVFFGATYLLGGVGLLIPAEHRLHLLVTVVLVGVVLVSVATITGLLPVLVFAAVLSVAVLATIVSIKTGLSKSKAGMMLGYALGTAVYVALLGLLTYAGYVLAERLNLPKPVLTALAVVAVTVVALVVVRGAIELRKLEEFLEERGYR